VTRRAPPLETQARCSITRSSVHRSSYRWTVWLLLTVAAVLSGCRILPAKSELRSLPLSRSKQLVDIKSSHGMVSRAAQLRITRRLTESGDTALLDYHLGAMQELGAPPLLMGNRVGLLVDGPRTYDAMFDAIDKARTYVLVESFIFEEAEANGRHLSDLLAAAVKRGVRVYVLYDAIGSLSTDSHFLDGLGRSGISLCAFNPLNPLDPRFSGINQRDHRKVVVVDGQLAFAGGVNFSHAYRIASKQQKRGLSKQKAIDEGWRDTHLEIDGTGAGELERLFRETWTAAECGKPVEPAPLQPHRAGDTLVQVVGSTAADKTNVIYATMLSVITYAQKSIDITMAYFVPDDQLEKTLIAAAQRGVQVRIIVPSYSDFSGVFYAGRAHYDELLKAGVKLYELENAFLHSKSIVVDGVWSSIGSTNFDWRSFVHNNEISVCVIGQPFALEMARMFDADMEASDEITLAEWKHRGFKERMRELMWLPFQYYL
jgi:cardiolipin synthase